MPIGGAFNVKFILGARSLKQGNNECILYIIGCTIQVPRVVYSHHISGSIRSSNLADPHHLIRGCGSAILLDRIEVNKQGTNNCIIIFFCILQQCLVFLSSIFVNICMLIFYDMGHIYCYRKRFSSDMSCHKSPPCRPIMNCFHN